VQLSVSLRSVVMPTRGETTRRGAGLDRIPILTCVRCDAVLAPVGNPDRPITAWQCPKACGAPAHTFNRDTNELCCSRFLK